MPFSFTMHAEKLDKRMKTKLEIKIVACNHVIGFLNFLLQGLLVSFHQLSHEIYAWDGTVYAISSCIHISNKYIPLG